MPKDRSCYEETACEACVSSLGARRHSSVASATMVLSSESGLSPEILTPVHSPDDEDEGDYALASKYYVTDTEKDKCVPNMHNIPRDRILAHLALRGKNPQGGQPASSGLMSSSEGDVLYRNVAPYFAPDVPAVAASQYNTSR